MKNVMLLLASSLYLYSNQVFSAPVKVCDSNTRAEYLVKIQNKQLIIETSVGWE